LIAPMAPYLKPKDGNGNGLRVGYVVDDHEHDDREPLDARLPLLQHADLEDKVVLLRVDHNVVKKGQNSRSPCSLSFESFRLQSLEPILSLYTDLSY